MTHLEDPREDTRENREVGDTKDSARHAAKWDTRRRQNVDGESLASRRKMPTAEKAEDNLNKKKMEESQGCVSSGT